MSADTKPGFLCRISADGTPLECWTMTDKPLVVGRGESVDAFVEDDALSRSHFMIDREGASFILVDLSSSNGTLVNGNNVTARSLHPLDVIEAGESRFCFFLYPPEIAFIPASRLTRQDIDVIPNPAA